MRSTATVEHRDATGPRKLLDVVLIAGFLAAIGAPTIDQMVRPDEARGPAPELRSAAPPPVWDWTPESAWRYPDRYEAHFRDTFGLRDKLLRAHSMVKLFLFGVSPTPTVAIGKDDWMFFTGDRSIEVYRGLLPFSERELEAWKRMLEAHRDYLADEGIAHLYVIAPNKEAVNPEFVPERFNRLGPTRLDQLVQYLRRNSTLRILDLRAALTAVNHGGNVEEFPYFPLGTHWNGRGAYEAYAEILRALAPRFPALAPLELDDLQRIIVPGYGDSWGKSMYIEDLLPQTEIRYLPAPMRAAIQLETAWGPERKIVTEVAEPKLPRALLLHDSFGPYIEQLLAEHFSHLTCAWIPRFDTALIEAEKPDVVIEMYVERALVVLAPTDSIPRNTDAQARLFNSTSDVRFALDPGRVPTMLEPEAQARCTPAEFDGQSVVEIRTTSMEDTVLLPAFPLPADGRVIVYFDIESPAATTLDLFYMLEGDKKYKHHHHAKVDLAHGKNQVFIRLDQPGMIGRLRFRPGRLATTYLVRAIEVRALAGS